LYARRGVDIAVELFSPFHHIAAAAVFCDELVHLVAAFAPAPAAFNAQHVEVAFDVAENEIGSVARAYSITSSARASTVGGISRPSALTVFKLMTSSSLNWKHKTSAPKTLA
jgi:hypothetical protein